jgi:hypothetical protein
LSLHASVHVGIIKLRSTLVVLGSDCVLIEALGQAEGPKSENRHELVGQNSGYNPHRLGAMRGFGP